MVGGVGREIGPTEQQVGGSDDAIERGADFVAHVGEKLALGARGLGGAEGGGLEIAGADGHQFPEIFVQRAGLAQRLLAAVVGGLDQVDERQAERENEARGEQAVAQQGGGGEFERAREGELAELDPVEGQGAADDEGEEDEGEAA